MANYRRLFVRTMALAVCSAALLSAGCSEKIYSDPQMTADMTTTTVTEATVTPIDYASIKSRIDQYTLDINAYMKDHIQEAYVNTVDGTTPAGYSAECTYTVSDNGVYRSLQMVREDEQTRVVDEYFDLEDAFYMVHTVFDLTDNTYESPVKYYIKDGIAYKLDRETETLITVADINTQDKDQLSAELDMYLSFEDITAVYG